MTLYKHFLAKATKALEFARLAAPSTDDQNTIDLLLLSIRSLTTPTLDLSKESGLPRRLPPLGQTPGPQPLPPSAPSVPLWCESQSPGPQPATTDAPGERIKRHLGEKQ